MELVVRGKNIELAEPTRDYVEKKLFRIGHHLPTVTEAKVEVSKENSKSPLDRYVVQITLNNDGVLLRAEEQEEDIRAAIDAAAHDIDRQVRRYKDKLYLKNRKLAQHRIIKEPLLPDEQAEEAPAKIVKVKTYPIKPMTQDEAIEQMELLGHDFFFFLNGITNRFNVLYIRSDGDYGLIVPE